MSLEVYITTYYFDRDPRICFVQNEPGLSLSIDQLITKYKDHRLMIFTEGEKFFSPLTGKIEPWADIFSAWTHRAILTSEPTENWGYWEQVLAQYFTVLPATIEGLELFIQAIQQDNFIYEPPFGVKNPIPQQLKIRPRRWIQHDAPDPALVDEMIASLQHYLGDTGYYWLSACAIYPALNWNLTLYLGNTIYDHDQQKLFESRRLINLARLPWFRVGYMPAWLRVRLISELPHQYENSIRLALQKLFLNTVQGATDAFPLEIVTKHTILIKILTRPILRLLAKKAPIDSPLRDHVFVNFIAGWWHTQLAVRLPIALDRLFVQKSRAKSYSAASTQPLGGHNVDTPNSAKIDKDNQPSDDIYLANNQSVSIQDDVVARNKETTFRGPVTGPVHTESGNTITHIDISVLQIARQWFTENIQFDQIPPHLNTSWVGRSVYLMRQLTNRLTAHHWWTLMIALTLWAATVWLLTPILQWPLAEPTARARACLLYALATLVLPFFVTLTTLVDRFSEINLSTHRDHLRFWFLKLTGAYTGFALAAGAVGVALVNYYLGGQFPRGVQWLLALIVLFFSHIGARRIAGDRLHMYGEVRLHEIDRLVVVIILLLGPGMAAAVYWGYETIATPAFGLSILIGFSAFVLWESRKNQLNTFLTDWGSITIFGLLLPLTILLIIYASDKPLLIIWLPVFNVLVFFVFWLLYRLGPGSDSEEAYASLRSDAVNHILQLLLALALNLMLFIFNMLIKLPSIDDFWALVNITPYFLGTTLLMATIFVRNPPVLTIPGMVGLLVTLLGISYGLNINLWLGRGLVIIAVLFWIVWSRSAWHQYLWVHPSFEWLLVAMGVSIYLWVQMIAPLWMLLLAWLLIVSFLTVWAYRSRR